MKRLNVFLYLILIVTSALAQTQTGVVKTRGRMVNGEHIPGNGLPGAVISIKDRTDVGVRGEDGSFTFPVTENQFIIESVTKKDYVLVDADAAPKTYVYSPNPLYLIMETPEKQLEDQLASERRIRRTLQRQLSEREDEIESLRAENKITQQEYHLALQKLYSEQENNEKLIKEMAERYSQLDYDQMDEFYRRVNNYIEQGELVRADSLLRSRGDVSSQVAAQLEKGKSIQEKEAEIQKAKEVYQHDKEELARRCYGYFENFKIQHENDSAAYYIELRAKLDTTNVEWLNDAGIFIETYQARYDDALKYFELGLNQSIVEYGEGSKWATTLYNNVGHTYSSKGDYSRAMEYYNKALLIQENLLDGDRYVATSYMNIGKLYDVQGDYNLAMEYYHKSLSIFKEIYGNQHPNVANCYHNIGSALFSLGNYTQALEYFQSALDIYTKADIIDQQGIALVYDGIGGIYDKQGDYNEALEYFKKSLSIKVKIFGEKHPTIAISYNNIGHIYFSQKDYNKALEYCLKSLAIRKNLLGTDHPDVATAYNNLGMIYFYLTDYDKAVEYINISIRIRENIFGTNHPSVASSYNNIGAIYLSQGDYNEALEFTHKALVIREEIFGENHPSVANSYSSLSDIYFSQKDYTKSLECQLKASAIEEMVYGRNHPYIAISFNNIGEMYFWLGEYDKSLEYLSEAYNIFEKALGNDHQNTLDVKEKIELIKKSIGE